MKRSVNIIFTAALVVLLPACPAKDETSAVRQRVLEYWRYLYSGMSRAAYDMLDLESRALITYSDYANLVGFGTVSFPEIDEYWKVYSTLTEVEVNSVAIQGNTALVSLTITRPHPRWFPTKANEEATRLGLTGDERGRFLVRAQTEALRAGEIPIVKIETSIRLVKESAEWRIVFKEEEAR